ncbi:MAG: glycosyltransferase family 4 protein [Candidatus Dojkabacteria bacterium]
MEKIALVLYYYQPYVSGLSKYAQTIAEELAASGNYEVTVITSKYESSISPNETINNVKVLRKKVWLSFGKGVIAPGIIWELFKKRNKFDKVFVFVPFGEAGIIPLVINKNKLFSFYVCDINLGKSFIMKIVEKISFLSARVLLNRSKKIIPLSDDYMFHSRIFKENDKSKVISLFPKIEEPDLSVTKDQVAQYKSRYGIKENDFVVGFLGRIVFEKGIEYLIDTVPLLKDKIKNLKIFIGGDYKNVRGGSVYDNLKDKIESYKENIIVTGFVLEEEKSLFLHSSNVFVLPSIDPLEAFGIVQVESMICDVPVIASSLFGVREVVNNTKFGFLASPKSSEELAEKIMQVYENADKLKPYKDEYKKYYSNEIWKKQLYKILAN